MYRTNSFIITILTVITFGFIYSVPVDDYKYEGENHIKNVKMLTDGGENAEAYLSFDENKLIFQATVGNIKCDQIFTMNIDGSDKKMVSTGFGRTTCSYFLPGDKRIIYSSTHLSDKDCPAPPDFSNGYVWKLYDSFDIFSANADGSGIKQITFSESYDFDLSTLLWQGLLN